MLKVRNTSVRGGAGLPWSVAAMAAAGVLASATTVAAYEFEIGDEVTGSIQTVLSAGAQMRVADRDPRNYGYYYGGLSNVSDIDDGNLNYDKYDLISQVSTISSELKLKWRNYFAFVRGAAFYDSIAANNDLADFKPELRPYTSGRYPEGADNRADWDAELLDYYVGGNFDLGGRNLTVKIGSQILNWGEALFTINGISVVNPIDVKKIRVPGAELKDALIPVPMISVGLDLADNLSMEAFYQLDFKPFKLDACGSFFSTTDNFCDGVKYVSTTEDPFDPRSYTASTGKRTTDYDNPNKVITAANFPMYVEDDPDVHDWGVSLKYFSPDLNNTEFQFYFARYTSRLPSAYWQSPDKFADGTGQVNAAALPVPLVQGLLDQLGVDQLNALTSALSGLLGGPVTDLVGALTNPLTEALIQPPFGTSPRSKVLENLDNGRFTTYYPSGLNMLGFAFNTTYDPLGVAINAEVSWKHDVPILISESAIVTNVYNAAGGVPISQGTTAKTPVCIGTICVPNPGIAPFVDPGFHNPDNQFIPGRRIDFAEKHDVWQAAVRFTKILGGSSFVTRLLGANQLFAFVELGAIHVDLDPNVQYAGYGQTGFTGFSTRPLLGVVPSIAATDLGVPFYATAKEPTQWSGGVQGLFFWDYPGVYDGVTLTPSIGFSYGIFGNTPASLPGFTKSVTSMNFGLKINYLDNWSMNINYFKSWGGGSGGSGGASRNPYIDRDFVGVNVAYSF